jgi:hypothetical protein
VGMDQVKKALDLLMDQGPKGLFALEWIEGD